MELLSVKAAHYFDSKVADHPLEITCEAAVEKFQDVWVFKHRLPQDSAKGFLNLFFEYIDNERVDLATFKIVT